MSIQLSSYCSHCNVPFQPGAAVCPSCSRGVGALAPNREGKLSRRGKLIAAGALLGFVFLVGAYLIHGIAGIIVLVIVSPALVLFLAAFPSMGAFPYVRLFEVDKSELLMSSSGDYGSDGGGWRDWSGDGGFDGGD